MARAKDQTVVGITGKPIPKPRTAKQQYELEKKRRQEKHLGKNVGGTQYRSDVTPYYNPRARTFEEFMSICEAVSQSDARLARSGVISRHADALQREIDDVTSGRKKQKPTTKRKVTKISFIDRSNAKLREEAQLDEVVVTRSPEVKQRAKNIKKIKDKKQALAALMKHAKLQKQGLADEVEYDGENVDEVLMVTPATKKPTKKVVKSVTKIEKPDPSDPDYVRKQRAYVKLKQQEMVDYERLRSGAEAATDRAAAVKKAKQQRQQSDAEAARSAFRTKGVPFSDAKGSGHIVNGKKVYAS